MTGQVQMPLLNRLKNRRARPPGKQPLPETAFAAVAALVQRYALTAVPAADQDRANPVPGPRSPRLALFPLLTPDQYRLAQDILARFDNPYLPYARSPAEIRLSLQLYQADPHLAAETLQTYSLETLWAAVTRPQEGGEVGTQSF